MPTSAVPTALRRRARPPCCGPRAARRPLAQEAGFTLIEVLIALSIIALVAAVVLPSLARRLDAAFSDADLQQALSSAQALPVRVVTMAVDLTLDAASLSKPLPDGRLALDLPSGWQATVEKAPRLWQSGTCDAGSLLLTETLQGRRWRVAFARQTCEVTITALIEGDA